MIKVYLLKGQQHDIESYIGFVNAKDLVRLATQLELNEAQSPISSEKVNSIANYVSLSSGVLSTSVVVCTKDDRIKVKHESSNLYYMEFPETEEEFEKYKDSFDIMDGQHRLFSFLKEYKITPDNEKYDISFHMYIKPSLTEKRYIFINTNEKQEKVSPNLLMWFKKNIDLLSTKEKNYYQVVSMLNCEDTSPLKGYIVMGAEKIIDGYKASQIMNILDKANIKFVSGLDTGLETQKIYKLVSIYLRGWEKAVGKKMLPRTKKYSAFSRISGLRFMLLLLPAFYKQAVEEQSKITEEYICNKINEMTEKKGILASDIFNEESHYFKQLGFNPFTGEITTINLAKEWINVIKSIETDSFNPLA